MGQTLERGLPRNSKAWSYSQPRALRARETIPHWAPAYNMLHSAPSRSIEHLRPLPLQLLRDPALLHLLPVAPLIQLDVVLLRTRL